ncbi:GNAT family N-acetyltransferase [Paeniglutamicibacter sp. R2-26]|uniref:GNAT family N-acetyltransferase n=1 Tax=Paeniglutamicibacter sp. R2-26 TaxID=3144417 RepID=UPI003EE77DA3
MQVRRRVDLTAAELDAIENPFDNEYRNEFGAWNPDVPYGYSPADTHVLAFHGQALAAHVAFQRRQISVGSQEILVAGTGGVLVDERYRGTGLGGRTLRHAQTVMRDETGVDFGFHGCRREIVPIYESAGWVQVHAVERCLSRLDQTSVVVSEGGSNLVCSAKRHASQWAQGDIDLRGTPR